MEFMSALSPGREKKGETDAQRIARKKREAAFRIRKAKIRKAINGGTAVRELDK